MGINADSENEPIPKEATKTPLSGAFVRRAKEGEFQEVARLPKKITKLTT
jgi:hypothetical protein